MMFSYCLPHRRCRVDSSFHLHHHHLRLRFLLLDKPAAIKTNKVFPGCRITYIYNIKYTLIKCPGEGKYLTGKIKLGSKRVVPGAKTHREPPISHHRGRYIILFFHRGHYPELTGVDFTGELVRVLKSDFYFGATIGRFKVTS